MRHLETLGYADARVGDFSLAAALSAAGNAGLRELVDLRRRRDRRRLRAVRDLVAIAPRAPEPVAWLRLVEAERDRAPAIVAAAVAELRAA